MKKPGETLEQSPFPLETRSKLVPIILAASICAIGITASVVYNTRNIRSQFNREIQCQLLSEGRSLHEGDYKAPKPDLRDSTYDLKNVLNEVINSCEEDFGITVDKQKATDSMKKTDEETYGYSGSGIDT